MYFYLSSSLTKFWKFIAWFAFRLADGVGKILNILFANVLANYYVNNCTASFENKIIIIIFRTTIGILIIINIIIINIIICLKQCNTQIHGIAFGTKRSYSAPILALPGVSSWRNSSRCHRHVTQDVLR